MLLTMARDYLLGNRHVSLPINSQPCIKNTSGRKKIVYKPWAVVDSKQKAEAFLQAMPFRSKNIRNNRRNGRITRVYQCTSHIDCQHIFRTVETRKVSKAIVFESGHFTHSTEEAPSIHGIHPMYQSFIDDLIRSGKYPKTVHKHCQIAYRDAPRSHPLPTIQQISNRYNYLRTLLKKKKT